MISSMKRFGFGKYRGRLVIEVAEFDPSYIWWVENNMEHRFTDRVKRTARRAMNRIEAGYYYESPSRRMFF